MRDIELENYMVEIYEGDETLWVTFDHAGLPKHAPEGRPGWAVPELVKHDWSVVAVKARHPDWYLKPDIAAFFKGPAFAEVLRGKTRVILYGLSMGGFGALAFSTLIPGSVVLAISPQTTLDPAKVPWEKRFDYALGEDWTGPRGDIEDLTPAHAEAYVLYSPLNKFDGPHVDRLNAFGPITHLRLKGNAHVPGAMLMETGLLKGLVQAIGAGPLTEDDFDALCTNLDESAAYHYHVAQETEDTLTRETALIRCLDLAPPLRRAFYAQRAASLMMREAARAGDALRTVAALDVLRACTTWPGQISLKLMALRFLVRVEAAEDAALVLEEIHQDHPDGHPKLANLEARVARLAALDAAVIVPAGDSVAAAG